MKTINIMQLLSKTTLVFVLAFAGIKAEGENIIKASVEKEPNVPVAEVGKPKVATPTTTTAVSPVQADESEEDVTVDVEKDENIVGDDTKDDGLPEEEIALNNDITSDELVDDNLNLSDDDDDEDDANSF